jgi:RND superfamily putative drug exporter
LENLVHSAGTDLLSPMITRLAHLTYFHPKRVLAGVAVFLVAAIVLGGGVADRLKPAGFTDPGAESSLAAEDATRALGYDPAPGVVVVATALGRDIRTPAARREVERLAGVLAADHDVATVRTPFQGSGNARLLSNDRGSALILAHFSQTDEGELEAAAERIPPLLRSESLDLSVGGFAISFKEVNEAVREDLLRAELIAFPVLAILLLLVFRGLIAASLPLAIGGIAVVGTFLSLRLLSEFTDVSIFALNITTALGLGLAVDYGLLLVSRFREELERAGPGWEAHRRTMETAGRAVFFSGLTVAAAVASMIVLPQRFIYSMGAGAASVALLAAAAALLATPAILALLGERVNSLSVRRSPVATQGRGRWHRLARAVMRRPIPVALGVTVVLLIAATPLTGATLTQPSSEALPADLESRKVTDTLASDFTPQLDAPISATVPAAAAGEIRSEIAGLDGVLAVSKPQTLGGGAALIQATPADEPLSSAAQETTREIRSISASSGDRSSVGGVTAEFVDFKQSLLDHAPLVGGLIAATTTILLFLLTGSLILPIKTLVMNVLSIAATLGVLVIVFQEGFGAGLFAYDGPSAIETGLLVVLAATTFGLATDYAVLVLARIKEHHDQGMDNESSVALGIERTGRVITAAALLLAVVFLAFTTSSIFFMKQVGFGQALAVVIDASIVRALLVPALMRLLGDWNWWAPRPLRRLHERFALGEPPIAPAQPGPGAG